MILRGSGVSAGRQSLDRKGPAMSRLLSYLPVLGCPLVMLLCMAGMRRMGNPSSKSADQAADQAKRAKQAAQAPDRTAERTADRIATLEQELADLHTQRQRHRRPPGPPADPGSLPARTQRPSPPPD